MSKLVYEDLSLSLPPVVVYGDFTGSTNINTVATHVFTFVNSGGSTALKANTTYLRNIQFTVVCVTNAADQVELRWNVGKGLAVATLKRDLDGGGIPNDFKEPLNVESLITSDGSGVDTFSITVINAAFVSLVVDDMVASYSEIRYA